MHYIKEQTYKTWLCTLSIERRKSHGKQKRHEKSSEKTSERKGACGRKAFQIPSRFSNSRDICNNQTEHQKVYMTGHKLCFSNINLISATRFLLISMHLLHSQVSTRTSLWLMHEKQNPCVAKPRTSEHHPISLERVGVKPRKWMRPNFGKIFAGK